jgi:hypothetical protein
LTITRFKAGNQVGEVFWKMLLAEHGLDQSGVGVYWEGDVDVCCLLTEMCRNMLAMIPSKLNA